ncbi:MAG: GIY-YIG nuclease family protein [Thiolinea sp.]|jgi:putative endonuclease
MEGYMYILRCVDDSYYTGSTKNMTIRLWQHQNGLGAKHTAKRLPVELVYVEVFDRIDEAFWREKQVQGWSRKKKEALMASDFNQLHLLAECQNETTHRSLSEVEGNSSECGGDVGFDSADFDSAQSPQPTGSDRSLSGTLSLPKCEVEGSNRAWSKA